MLIKTSFGFVDCGVVIAALLMPATAARVHVNVTPLVVLVGVYVKAFPLQIAAGVNVLLSEGVGVNETGSELIPFATTTNE